MNIKEIMQDLTKMLKASTVLQDEPMKKHTSFKVGGTADIYVKASTLEDIKELVRYA